MSAQKRKGIILAGGTGTRLYPVTHTISKQLLPLYDKPMIYYPLSILMLTHIQDIAIISTPRDLPLFQELLGDGSKWGLSFTYITQPSPDGLAQAYLLAETFLDGAPSTLILGDNIFFGEGLSEILKTADKQTSGGTIFGYQVSDPEHYGVVDFDAQGRVLSIEEKPAKPKSPFAVTGVYFLDGKAAQYARQIKPSPRGELEITDLLNIYREMGKLDVKKLGRGIAWLDTGTHENLLDAANFVRTLESRQNLKIACPEEIAFLNDWITKDQLLGLAEPYLKTQYGAYLKDIAEGVGF